MSAVSRLKQIFMDRIKRSLRSPKGCTAKHSITAAISEAIPIKKAEVERILDRRCAYPVARRQPAPPPCQTDILAWKCRHVRVSDIDRTLHTGQNIPIWSSLRPTPRVTIIIQPKCFPSNTITIAYSQATWWSELIDIFLYKPRMCCQNMERLV